MYFLWIKWLTTYVFNAIMWKRLFGAPRQQTSSRKWWCPYVNLTRVLVILFLTQLMSEEPLGQGSYRRGAKPKLSWGVNRVCVGSLPANRWRQTLLISLQTVQPTWKQNLNLRKVVWRTWSTIFCRESMRFCRSMSFRYSLMFARKKSLTHFLTWLWNTTASTATVSSRMKMKPITPENWREIQRKKNIERCQQMDNLKTHSIFSTRVFLTHKLQQTDVFSQSSHTAGESQGERDSANHQDQPHGVKPLCPGHLTQIWQDPLQEQQSSSERGASEQSFLFNDLNPIQLTSHKTHNEQMAYIQISSR